MTEVDTSIDNNRLKRLYGRLKGLKDMAFSVSGSMVSSTVFDDFNSIVLKIQETVGNDPDIKDFLLPQEFRNAYGDLRMHVDNLNAKLLPLLSYLEVGYGMGEQVIEIGSIYNSINDEELKARCADILTAKGNFDRVINQATQVLEDRIRTKAKQDKSRTGVQLVNHVLNGDPSKTILVVSENKDEHEGICHTLRGIMLAFRNPSHHTLTDKISREDALKVCGFVDNLLKIIDKSVLKT